MKEKTLIPLDGSRSGEAALHYIEDFIDKLKPAEVPEVTLLEVISPRMEHVGVEGGYVDIVDGREDPGKATAEAAEYLEKSAGVLRSKGVVVNSKVVVSENPHLSYESIIEVEEEIHPDLVAMSSHNRPAIIKWFHDNTAEKVARKGKTPVLLVHSEV